MSKIDTLGALSIAPFREKFLQARPFSHIVFDNFLRPEVAEQIANEFPDWNDQVWYRYDNAIEKKKTMNFWDRFQPTTYQLFAELMSEPVVKVFRELSGIPDLVGDVGLSGGGLHAHKSGDKLNMHLDYSVHPKLKMERRLNIIIYITPGWQPEWGGGLELWSHNPETNRPLECVTRVENRFNRAVLFDTTQNSWHGLPTPIGCPEGVYRRSLAAYYVTQPRSGCDPRGKALFAPMAEQENDESVLELIKKRSQENTAGSVYKS